MCWAVLKRSTLFRAITDPFTPHLSTKLQFTVAMPCSKDAYRHLFRKVAYMFSTYSYSIAGLLAISLMVFVQNIVAAIAHRKQSRYIPGKVSEELSHDSFVFRSHRTFHNSLENVHQFTLPAILCIFLGASTTLLAILVWCYFFARLAHMALYYLLATEKNPSPRSYLYIVGVLSTFGVFILAITRLFG